MKRTVPATINMASVVRQIPSESAKVQKTNLRHIGHRTWPEIDENPFISVLA